MVSYRQQLQQFEGPELKKDYFGILASLALLIVLILIIYPAVKHVVEINKEISDARVIKAGLEAKLDALDQARKNYDEVKNDLGVLDLALPVGSNFPPYLKNVENLSAQSHTVISNAEFKNVPLTKIAKNTGNLQINKIAYQVTLDGKFPDYLNFLINMEKFIRVSDVTAIDIEEEKQGTGTSVPGKLTGTFEITAYFLGTQTSSTTSSTSSTQGGTNQ